MSTSIDDYIKNRLDDQIVWYGGKSQLNKFRYRMSEVVIIVAGALVTVLNSVAGYSTTSADFATIARNLLLISATLGGIIIAVTAFSKMEKYFETWILYRTNVELLKREKFLFFNNAGQYANLSQDGKNAKLVEAVEFILSSEVNKFFAMQQQGSQTMPPEEKKNQPGPSTELPAQVSGLTVTIVNSSQLDLGWTMNYESDIQQYNVYRGTAANFAVIPGTTPPTGTSITNFYSSPGLSPSTTYYYKVAAVNKAGKIGTLSAEQSGRTTAQTDIPSPPKDDRKVPS